MKKRVFALMTALCMVLTLLPGTVFAAAVLPEPDIAVAALPEEDVQPRTDEETYTISLTYSGSGCAELRSTTAKAQETVYLFADPEPGYRMDYSKSRFYYKEHKLSWAYIGNNLYAITMPDGNVKLDLEFVPIESESHDIILTATGSGEVLVSQETGKKGESIFVRVKSDPGYAKGTVRARSEGQWIEGAYLKRDDGWDLYEILMPDAEMELLVDFRRNGPYTITPYVEGDGTVELSHSEAYELETITITATPDRGHEIASVGCYHSQVTRTGENTWTFVMPKFKEEVHVSFAPISYPVSVATETPMGGTAVLDRETATIGQTVTLTCTPDEGYRVARITGAELTDNGDHTYTFVMDNAPVELSVLFLREGNPFLDVNETRYFHDSVLWAVENGITNGLTETTFGPDEACSRAQVVTFLWRAAGSPIPEGAQNPFADVQEGRWYTNAVLWAVENGITNGLTETTFGPNEVCNRAQVVTFLHRANGSPEHGLEENPFTDVEEGRWYTNAVLWAVENGITTGMSDTVFNPLGQCLRAQVVTFLYRADQIPEPEPEPLPFPDLG